MARRVNTKFLVILTCVVLGLLMAAVLASKFLIRESPEKYVTAGNQLMSEKRFDEAAKNFGHAVMLNQNDPKLWVAYGDALNELSPTDTEFMKKARAAWESALSIDASYKPALDRMMSFWSDVANNYASQPAVFEGLHDTATKLFAADPSNAAAEVAMVTSVIRPWLSGVERDPKLIEDNVNKLVELSKKYPENPDIPMFAAQAKLRMAERRRQQDPESKQAQQLVAEAGRIVDDSVARAAKSPSAAAMYFAAAQVYQAQELTDQKQTTVWRQKKRDMYAKAREVAKVDDPLYVFIHINSARSVADDKVASEKILRALMEKMPDDQMVRMALAEQLAADREKRAEAITILEKPFASANLRGPKAELVKDLQIRTLVMLTNLRIEEYATAKPDERAKLIEPIKDAMAKIEAKDGVGPRSLRLKGKLLRLQGQTIEAIQTLEKAKQMSEQRGNEVAGNQLERWEVIDLLAKAYIETNQMGQAKTLLTGLVNRFPGYDPARMLLTQILVKDGSYDEARPHVAYFKQKDPTNPDVIKWDIQMMDPRAIVKDSEKQGERKQLRDVYAKLPEKTKAEMIDKISAAMVIDNQDDGVRLLNKAQQEFPGDYEIARTAVRVYRSTGEIDNAKAAVALALKANPTDEKLQILSRQVADLNVENLLTIQEEELKKSPDEFAKNIGLANIARRRNKPDEALSYLQAAVKAKPDNGDVQSLIFNHYVWQKQYEKADAMLDKLSRANQDQTGGLLFRYRLAMAKEDYPQAMNYARGLTQRMGEFGQSWLALAQVQQALNQFDEALKNYAAALEKQSDSPEALRGAIECYYALNRPSEARNKIRDARRAMPSNTFFQEMEINHELNYGNPENAVQPREEQAKRNPDRPNTVMALGQAYLATARSYANKPEKDAAMTAMYGKARDTFRNGVTKWPDEIAFYAYYAETAARSGQYVDTEQLLKQLAARDAWKDKTEPLMLMAEFYGITRRFGEAETQLRAIIAKEPKNTELQVRLANLLINQNKVDDALKALEANADDTKVARRRVEVLLTAGRLEEAEKSLEEILKRTPSNLEMLQMAANVQLTRNKYPEAEQKLNRALEIEPNNATTHYFVGLLKMNQPKPDTLAAIEEFKKGKDSPTLGVDSSFAMAEALKRRSDVDGAIRELESAMQRQPTNKRVRLALIDAYLGLQPPRSVDAERAINEGKRVPGMAEDTDLMQREVTILAAKGDSKKAAELVNQVLKANPDDMQVVRKSLDLLLKSRRYTDVNDRAAEVLKKDPNAWWAYVARATAKRYQDRKAEALQDFEAAIDAAGKLQDDFAANDIVSKMGDVIGPDEAILRIQGRQEPKWKIMTARLQQTKGDTTAAVRTLESVLAIDEQLSKEDKINAYRFGGTLYLVVADANKSKACYEKLLVLAPEDMTALNNIACLLAEVTQPPNPKEGVKYSQRAYDLMTKSGRRDALVLDTHGWLLTNSGDVDKGIETLRNALQVKRIPDAHYHLGEAYLKKSFADEALRELEMAHDLFKQMKADKLPVDMSLEAKIEGALARANILVRQKGKSAPAAGAAPTAAAAPAAQ